MITGDYPTVVDKIDHGRVRELWLWTAEPILAPCLRQRRPERRMSKRHGHPRIDKIERIIEPLSAVRQFARGGFIFGRRTVRHRRDGTILQFQAIIGRNALGTVGKSGLVE